MGDFCFMMTPGHKNIRPLHLQAIVKMSLGHVTRSRNINKKPCPNIHVFNFVDSSTQNEWELINGSNFVDCLKDVV